MKIIITFLISIQLHAADWLWVRFYSHEPNPTNIPKNWPAAVREIKGETNQPPPSGEGWQLFSVADFKALKTQRKVTYDSWADGMENPHRREDFVEAVRTQAAERVKEIGFTDETRARLVELGLQAIEAGGAGNLTLDLQSELATLRAVGNKAAAIRAREKVLIAAIAAKTPVDTASGWPK